MEKKSKSLALFLEMPFNGQTRNQFHFGDVTKHTTKMWKEYSDTSPTLISKVSKPDISRNTFVSWAEPAVHMWSFPGMVSTSTLEAMSSAGEISLILPGRRQHVLSGPGGTLPARTTCLTPVVAFLARPLRPRRLEPGRDLSADPGKATVIAKRTHYRFHVAKNTRRVDEKRPRGTFSPICSRLGFISSCGLFWFESFMSSS